MTSDFPIDAVVAWVDGNDPVHRAKRMKYSVKGVTDFETVGAETRFVQAGEIRFCVASILRYAPYFRKIFIVTDGQDPGLEDFLDLNFPERTTEVEIVDHSVLFAGYEQYLPVFNCRPIEIMLWRIPDLSEHFVYFNDDFMLCRPCERDTFFDSKGRAVCYAEKMRVATYHLIDFFKKIQTHGRGAGFKAGQCKAAEVLGRNWFPFLGHVPTAERKSVAQDYFATHEDQLRHQISYRFRDPAQFNSQVFQIILALDAGKCVLRPRKGCDVFVTDHYRKSYIERKIQEVESGERVKFLCFNSLWSAPKEDYEKAVEWICGMLGITL